MPRGGERIQQWVAVVTLIARINDRPHMNIGPQIKKGEQALLFIDELVHLQRGATRVECLDVGPQPRWWRCETITQCGDLWPQILR